MHNLIIDCYTDEPAGLGVPPYLGTYPRYIIGYLKEKGEKSTYITIDDIRLWKKHQSKKRKTKPSQKTDIATYNLTKNYERIEQLLKETDQLIIVLGVHVPGKYLSAIPGTLKEISNLIKDIPKKKVLTGPAIFGSQLFGGKTSEKVDLSIFDEINRELFKFDYDTVKEYAVNSADIIKQIPDPRMIEIETGRGCDIGKCSFCTEPIKNKVEFREKNDILKEIRAFYDQGARFFRLGKQTCFYTFPQAIDLLKETRKSCPDIKVLHIDNVNPIKVIRDKDHAITKALVKYGTQGNIAAFGVESFDLEVVKKNTLDCVPAIAYQAIKIINKYGAKRGENGMPLYLPGLNIMFGLIGETKKTHEENMGWLKKIYDDRLMLRRINIRQVAIFENTALHKYGIPKALKKNKKYYWKWRNEVRQKIDWPMLKRVVPKETILKNCYTEIYDGKKTFCRQFGTYPLIVGVAGRWPLKKFYDIKITSHMLRSLTGEINQQSAVETNAVASEHHQHNSASTDTEAV